MARPKADPNAVPTSRRILTAARAAFAAHGFESTRLADVAKAAGIRRPSLLYHFAHKEELYAAVIQGVFSELGESLTAAIDDPAHDFRGKLDALVLRYLEFLELNPAFASLVLREVLDGRGPGRDLILAQVVPLLDGLEAFLAVAGAGCVRPDLPARGAILQVAMAAIVRAASGPLREPLWGDGEPFPVLCRHLFLRED